MNCSEVRELLFAFLDNELEAARSIELQQHLERCCDCAREAEIERLVGKHVVSSLEASAPLSAADENHLLEFAVRPRAKRLQRRRLALLTAVLAAGVLGSASIWLLARRGENATPAPLSTELLVADFEHFLAGGQRLHFESDSADAVSSWIRRELDLRVEMQEMKGRCRLLGARTCSLAGRPAALALYDMEGQPATLLVLHGQEADLSGMEDLDGAHRVDRSSGHTVIACNRDDLTYAAVGKVSERELLELLP